MRMQEIAMQAVLTNPCHYSTTFIFWSDTKMLQAMIPLFIVRLKKKKVK